MHPDFPPALPARREQLHGLLGDLPPRQQPIQVQLCASEERDGYLLETLILGLNDQENVPAYFVRPLQGTGPFPCLLYNHAHGSAYHLGKTELLEGCQGLHSPPYARALTDAGYAALCIDQWNFGERQGLCESERFKLMLWKGQVLWGMMVHDGLRAFDYLREREDVAPDRIGVMGMSMGSTLSWWLAALEPCLKLCVDICCLTDYEALIETRHLDGHGLYYYVPALLKHFTTAQINELIVPRPHLSLAGNYDHLTPPRGLDRIDAHLKAAYAGAQASRAWRLHRFEVGHLETVAMRSLVMQFLREWL